MASNEELRKKLERLQASSGIPEIKAQEETKTSDNKQALKQKLSALKLEPQAQKEIAPESTTPFGPLVESFVDSTPEEREQLANSLKESAARTGVQTVFGVPAAMAGFAGGGPKGGIVGFGAGAFGGEGVFQGLQHLGVAPGEPPKTSLEALERMRDASVFSTTGDLLTRGGLRAFNTARNKLSNPFRKQVSPVVTETRDVFDVVPLTEEGKALQKEGVGFTLGQTLDNTSIDTAENMVASTWTGASKIRGLADRTEQFLQAEMGAYVDNLTQTVGSERVGDMAQAAIENNLAHKTLIERGLYAKLDKITGTTPVVSLKDLKKLAGDISSEFRVSDKITPVISKILNLPDRVTFKEAQRIRSQFLAITRTSGDLSPGVTIGDAKRLASVMDKSMDSSFEIVRKTLPDQASRDQARDIWRAAGALTRQKKELFNNKFIKALAEKDPDLLVDSLTKVTNADAVVRAQKAINNPSTWRQIQGSVLGRFMEKGTKSLGGQKVLSGDSVSGNIFKMKESVKKAFFGTDPVLFNNFEKMAKALARSQSVVRGTGGELMARFIQAKAAGDVIRGKSFGNMAILLGDTVLLTGPGQISRMFTNKKIIDGIIDGFKVARSTEEMTAFTGKIIGLLNANKIDYDITTKPQFDESQDSASSPFSKFADVILNGFKFGGGQQPVQEPPPANNLGPALLGR